MNRNKVLLIGSALVVLLLSVVSTVAQVAAAPATSSGAPSAWCGALDWNNPNWPFCVAGAERPGRGNGRAPVPTVVIPTPNGTPVSVGTIRCVRVGNSGNLRCTIGRRTFVVNAPRGISISCTSPRPGTLTCTFTVSPAETATAEPPDETETALPPPGRPPPATVTTTAEPPTITAVPVTTTAAPSTTAPPVTETMVMPSVTAAPSTTAGPSVTAEPSVTAGPPPVTATAGPSETATMMPMPAASATASAVPTVARGDSAELLRLVNAERDRAGVAPVILDEVLGAAAQGYTGTMAANEQQLINDPSDATWHGVDGTTAGGRTRAAGCQWTMMGENVAAGYTSPHDVMYGPDGHGGWMASPGHRANILNGAYTRAGFGHTHQAGGTFHEFWDQDFASHC